MWIQGLNESKYEGGQNIVSPKIYEAQGHFEKMNVELEKVGKTRGKMEEITDLFRFAIEQRIEGISLHSQGFYTKKLDYKGEYEKGRAKVNIADKYFAEALAKMRQEVSKYKSHFGPLADEYLEFSIGYYQSQ